MRYVEVEYDMSERHACRLLGLGRSTHRYGARKAERDAALRTRLKELAAKRMRFGCRRLNVMTIVAVPWVFGLVISVTSAKSVV